MDRLSLGVIFPYLSVGTLTLGEGIGKAGMGVRMVITAT